MSIQTEYEHEYRPLKKISLSYLGGNTEPYITVRFRNLGKTTKAYIDFNERKACWDGEHFINDEVVEEITEFFTAIKDELERKNGD